VGLRNPTTGIADCCARVASGHDAAPPSNVMNWRRLMMSPLKSARHITTRLRDGALVHHSKIDRRMTEMGQKRRTEHKPGACV
jgi:hypothetical protein